MKRITIIITLIIITITGLFAMGNSRHFSPASLENKTGSAAVRENGAKAGSDAVELRSETEKSQTDRLKNGAGKPGKNKAGRWMSGAGESLEGNGELRSETEKSQTDRPQNEAGGLKSVLQSRKDEAEFEKLWKEFDATVRSDRALKGMQVLEEIKKLAEEKRSAWDFYKAAEQYWRTGSQRDWKQNDSLRNFFQEEVARYDDPIMTFYNRKNDLTGLADFLAKNKDRLIAGYNPDFYENGAPTLKVFSSVLNKSLSNDYEYALWYVYLGWRNSYHQDWRECRDALKEYVGDKYPFAQFIKFNEISNVYDSETLVGQYREYAEKYQGKAVALMATQELLSDEFSELVKNKAGSDDYKAFRQKCADFEKERGKFKGAEKDIAECCLKVENLIGMMDDKRINSSITDGKITLSTQNISKVDIEIIALDKKGKKAGTVHKASVKNSVRSYYLQDTLYYDIPGINDGIYNVVCSEGKVSNTCDYSRYTISISDKQDKDGHHVYAAEAVSGRPLKNVTISLLNAESEVIAKADGLDFSNGYIGLPEGISEKYKPSERNQKLVCSYTDAAGVLHSSPYCYLNERYDYDRNGSDRKDYYAQLITDRSAFNPDETVHFKGVICYGDRRESLHTIPEGEKVTVHLRDTENNILETLELSSNEFGSVAGEFNLPRTQRNGLYSIELRYKGRQVEKRSVRVDDFVLPSFELSFEPDQTFHLPGDMITVKGKVSSYSGHSLSGATVNYLVEKYGTVVAEDRLKVSDDGSFELSFKSDKKDDAHYSVEVIVTDNTGETLRWSTLRNTHTGIPFSMNVLNPAQGEIEFRREDRSEYFSQHIISEDVLRLGFDVKNYLDGQTISRAELKISYTLKNEDKTIASGSVRPGEKLDIDLSGKPSGLYILEAESTCPRENYPDMKSSEKSKILLVRGTDTAVDADIENVFRRIDGDRIGLMLGTSSGQTWANVDVYGVGNVLLAHKFVNLSGVRSQKGSLESIVFDFKEEWSNVVDIQVLYFRNNKCYTYSQRFDRSERMLVMPLTFTRFEDRTSPRGSYTFEISTLAGAECAATIFDKSTETIMANTWNRLNLYSPQGPTVSVRNECGKNDGSIDYVVIGYGTPGKVGIVRSAARALGVNAKESMALPMPMADETVFSEADMEVDALPSMDNGGEPEVTLRENFANTIAFEPYLRSDEQGRISFSFTNADKLSTFYVQLWAHDRDMHNAVLRREMTVTIPVKVSVVEPQFLYTGDKYILQASVSSTVAETVAGRLRVEWYDGDKSIGTAEKAVTLKALGSEGFDFPIEVPAVAELGVKVTFISASREHGSDAVMVRIPVSPAVQTVTEAHSAILHSGESREELIASLRAMFVNTSGANAEVRDLSILDMVREAVPGHIEPASKNLLDMTDALYARRIAATLSSGQASGEREISDGQLAGEIGACRNSDGGFAWFAGMDSSPVITATLLARYASLRQHGLVDDSLAAVFTDEVITKAVQYLDKNFFGDKARPEWCGGISVAQYMAVRSSFCDVELNTRGLDRSELRSFRKFVRSYLVPAKERGLNGYIYEKARRMRVMYQLISSDEGASLAKSWGIKFFTLRRLNKSLKQDFYSIMEYAIEHKSGGWYFPNAVMPFRGLLETEAYAHVFMCDIIEDCSRMFAYDGPAAQPNVVADGLRLWLMVQKETQKWDESPAFVEALSTILAGSEDVLNTRIIALNKTVELPFSEVKKAENGMRIERTFYVQRVKDDREVYKAIAEGEVLNVGDVLKAEYKIWNEENRSFVRISAPRMASMRPVQQLSGRYGWWLAPLRVAGWYSFSPHGYRNVLRDGTEYWFDSYPEEHTTLSEEFFITQAGTFQMPAIEIESLYAPHYRAIGSAQPAITSSR